MHNNGSVLVTGAAGFIGSFLAKKFLRSGYQVIGIDNINSYYDKNLKLKRIENIREYSLKNNFNWLVLLDIILSVGIVGACFKPKKMMLSSESLCCRRNSYLWI